MSRVTYPQHLGLERAAYPLPPRKSFPEAKPAGPKCVVDGASIPLLPLEQAVQLPKDEAWGRVTMRLPEAHHARLGQNGRHARGVRLKLLAAAAGDHGFEACTGGAVEDKTGPMLQLMPSGARFSRPVELSFSVRSLVPEPQYADGREKGVLLVLRRRKGEQWLPLIGSESLSVAADGTATVQLRSSGVICAKYFPGAEGATRAAALVGDLIFSIAKELAAQPLAARPVAPRNKKAPPSAIASASVSVVNLVVTYASIAAGALLSASGYLGATGGLAGLATDPDSQTRFATDLQDLLRDPKGSALPALERAVKEVAAHKRLEEDIRPALEMLFKVAGLKWEQVEGFLVVMSRRDLDRAMREPARTVAKLVEQNLKALLRATLEPLISLEFRWLSWLAFAEVLSLVDSKQLKQALITPAPFIDTIKEIHLPALLRPLLEPQLESMRESSEYPASLVGDYELSWPDIKVVLSAMDLSTEVDHVVTDPSGFLQDLLVAQKSRLVYLKIWPWICRVATHELLSWDVLRPEVELMIAAAPQLVLRQAEGEPGALVKLLRQKVRQVGEKSIKKGKAAQARIILRKQHETERIADESQAAEVWRADLRVGDCCKHRDTVKIVSAGLSDVIGSLGSITLETVDGKETELMEEEEYNSITRPTEMEVKVFTAASAKRLAVVAKQLRAAQLAGVLMNEKIAERSPLTAGGDPWRGTLSMGPSPRTPDRRSPKRSPKRSGNENLPEVQGAEADELRQMYGALFGSSNAAADGPRQPTKPANSSSTVALGPRPLLEANPESCAACGHSFGLIEMLAKLRDPRGLQACSKCDTAANPAAAEEDPSTHLTSLRSPRVRIVSLNAKPTRFAGRLRWFLTDCLWASEHTAAAAAEAVCAAADGTWWLDIVALAQGIVYGRGGRCCPPWRRLLIAQLHTIETTRFVMKRSGPGRQRLLAVAPLVARRAAQHSPLCRAATPLPARLTAPGACSKQLFHILELHPGSLRHPKMNTPPRNCYVATKPDARPSHTDQRCYLLQQQMAIFQYKIIVFQWQFSILSAFSIEKSKKVGI